MSELGDVKAQAVVASGNGWSVGRFADGFDVRIERADGRGHWSATVEHGASEDQRNGYKDALASVVNDDVELDRIEAAFAAPWVQA